MKINIVPKSRYIEFIIAIQRANLDYSLKIRQGKLHEFFTFFPSVKQIT